MKKTNSKKTKEVLLSVFRQLSIALLGFLFPILVLKTTNPSIWGDFFEIFLFALIVSIISNWGSKEYLLLKFSKEPNLMHKHFSNHFFVRIAFLLFSIFIAFLLFDVKLSLFLTLWLIGRYLSWSFEVVNQYQKDNFTTSIIEYSTFLLLVILLKLTLNINSIDLVFYYALYQFIKGLIYLVVYFKWFNWNNFKIDWNELKYSFGFFLLAFSGFLVSKIDVFIASLFFPSTELGKYGLQNNLFLFAMAIGNMAILPFVKVLYRKNETYYAKIKKTYALFGLIISIFSIVFIYFLNTYYLKIYFQPLFYYIGFLYILPSYLYGMDVYENYKEKREKHVLVIFIIGALSLFFSNILFLKINHSLLTLLISATISQWIILALFKLFQISKPK